jgi:hypothetical protein
MPDLDSNGISAFDGMGQVVEADGYEAPLDRSIPKILREDPYGDEFMVERYA